MARTVYNRTSRDSLDFLFLIARVVLIYIALVALVFFPAKALAQTAITVRVINAVSGKPISGVTIGLSTWNTDESPVPAHKLVSRSSFQATDKNGEVVFPVPEPPPNYVAVDYLTTQLRGCSTRVFRLAEALRSGIVADYNPQKRKWCGKLKAGESAKPGVIVIFDRRLTLWDRLLQEIP
jgi:hypothetical protein